MAFIDAQDTSFTFDGVEVGKKTGYTIMDGVVPDIAHKPLRTKVIDFHPGIADFGAVTITLYRDYQDAGQAKMLEKMNTQKRVTCILTFSNGTTMEFLGYTKRLPFVGNDNGIGTADAVIKIAGMPVFS